MTIDHIIHIIDARSESRRTLLESLKSAYEVETSRSIAEFLSAYHKRHPDVVIINATLDRSLELIGALKGNSMAPATVYVTENNPDDIVRALDAGADDCLVMPVNASLLNHRIRQILAVRDYYEVEKYQALFDSANDGIAIMDANDGHFLDANPTILRWLGYTLPELKRLQLDDLYVDTPSDDYTDDTNDLTTRGTLIFEHTYLAKDGTTIPVEVSSRFITYNGQQAVLNFVRDIRQRRAMEAAEREQRELAQALSDTAAVVNSTLNLHKVINRILEQVDRVVRCDAANVMLIKDEFVRIIGHRGYEKYNGVSKQMTTEGLHIDSAGDLRHMIRTHQPSIVGNTATYEDWVTIPETAWVRSYIGVPIIYQDSVIGLLNLDSERVNAFTVADSEKLMAFAHQVGMALYNARLYQTIQDHAATLEKRVEERTTALVKSNADLKTQMIATQRAEADLTIERHLLRTVIDNLLDDVYVKDTEGRLVLVNRTIEEKLRPFAPDGKVLGTSDYDYVLPDEAADYIASDQEILNTGEPIVNMEVTHSSPNFGDMVLLITKIPLHDPDGNVIGLLGVNHDVTELRRADRERQRERNLLRTVIDNIPDDVYVKDRTGRFILVNKPLEKRLREYLDDDQSVIGTTNHYYMPDGRAQERDRLERTIMETGEAQINDEVTMVFRDGERHHQLATKVPLRDSQGNITGVVSINRDITTLKEAQERLQYVITGAHCLLWDGVVVADDAGEYCWDIDVSNEMAARQFLPVEQNPGESYIDAWQRSILPKDKTSADRRSHAAFDHNKRGYQQEFRCRRADGEMRWLRESVRIEPVAAGRWRLVGVCTDITERKRAEEALVQANDLLEARVVERTRALSEMNVAERKQRELAEALSDTASALSSSLALSDVLDRILTYAARVMPKHDAANIMLIEEETFVRIIRAREYHEGDSRFVTLPEDSRFYLPRLPDLQRVLDEDAPVIVADTQDSEHTLQWETDKPIRAYISAPIHSDGQIIGFVNFGSVEVDNFHDEDASRLRAFTDQAGIAIRNAQLYGAVLKHAEEMEQKVAERTAELEHERGQLSAILDAITEGVIYFDSNGRVQYVNRSLVGMTKYSEVEWQKAYGYIPADWMERDEAEIELTKVLEWVRLRGVWRQEIEMPRKLGGSFEANLTATYVGDSPEAGYVAVVRDISQEKRLETQKARFIANASHELRTPLTNLKTRLYLIERQPERSAVHLAVMDEVTERMRKLVDNLLDISRFEHGMIVLDSQPADIQDVIADVVRVQQAEAIQREITLTHRRDEASIVLSLDYDRMLQVFTNLVTNALNYTPPEGNVVINSRIINGDVMIEVRDTGSGIPPDLLPNIFKPFIHGSGKEGTGLGLSITREIVELHGGEISVTSEVGDGTCFEIKLPLVVEETFDGV